MVELSVVIPTYNRRAQLARCLDALRAQTLEPSLAEVIIIDDGSTDGTREFLARSPGIQPIYQAQNTGPAAARNAGIRAATGEFIVFLADDTYAPPDFLAKHLAAHTRVPGENVGVLGKIEWWQGAPVTPLMRYLTTGGVYQLFQFHAIQNSDDVPFGFFYTSNLSLSRAFLLRGGLFDADFKSAYAEDTELAYRLGKQGLRLVYDPAIVVAHDHPTSYASARRRAQNAGRSQLLMARKHPELADLAFLRYGLKTRTAILLKRLATYGLLDPLLELADRARWDSPRLRALYDRTLVRHQFWTMYDAVRRDPALIPSSARQPQTAGRV